MFYEITLITPENNTAEDMAEIRSTIEKWADIHTAEDNGVKRLAYAITLNGVEHNFGHYLFYTATLNDDCTIAKVFSENTVGEITAWASKIRGLA